MKKYSSYSSLIPKPENYSQPQSILLQVPPEPKQASKHTIGDFTAIYSDKAVNFDDYRTVDLSPSPNNYQVAQKIRRLEDLYQHQIAELRRTVDQKQASNRQLLSRLKTLQKEKLHLENRIIQAQTENLQSQKVAALVQQNKKLKQCLRKIKDGQQIPERVNVFANHNY